MKRETVNTGFLTALALMFCVLASSAQEVGYVPDFHGVFRGRWEMETESGESRFQVRNARVNMAGNIAPVVSYYIQADFCDRGKIKLLDAYGRLRIADGLSFQLGQFRMPFGVESMLGPSNYIFSNRSFMGWQMCNYRKVGAKAVWKIPSVPLSVEAGAFNSGGTGDQDEWSKSYSWSGKLTWTLGQFSIVGGALGIKPSASRVYMYDGALSWQNSCLKIAAEYMYGHYSDTRYKPAHSYCVFANFRRSLSHGFFNQWSVQGRFDGITSHWSGVEDEAVSPARNRITAGCTLTYRYKSVFADIRLNYEKYFYHSGVTAPRGRGDKILAELVVRF